MTNENELSDEELDAATAPQPPTPPEPDTEPTTGAPEPGARTHTALDAQPLEVDDYRPEPGTATFKDDRNGEDVELSGEARGNADLDDSNFAHEYPKRHVTRQEESFERESGLDVEEVAKQVNEGKWGTGQDRRIALSEHGYDPNEVQAASVVLLNKAKVEEDNKQL
jgi:hypothetical protein